MSTATMNYPLSRTGKSAVTSAARPFKKFYCDDREVFRLPGIAFKIWLYHYAREGRDRKSWPTVETICEALNINRSTLQRWRKYLVENGWLQRVGERRRLDGGFAIPEFKAKRGTVAEHLTDGRKSNFVHGRKLRRGTGTKTSATGRMKISSAAGTKKPPTEVDLGVLDSEKVDSVLLESNTGERFLQNEAQDRYEIKVPSPRMLWIPVTASLEDDKSRDDSWIVHLIADEQAEIANLPIPLTDWIAKQLPLDVPLRVVEGGDGSPIVLPYTERDGEYTEATANENYDVVVEILYGPFLKPADKEQMRRFVDYEPIWDLDIAYGGSMSVRLAEIVRQYCPKNRGFFYNRLQIQLLERALAA